MGKYHFHITRNAAALSIKVIVIVYATLAVYSQDLAIILNEAMRSELMTHIIAIPFMFIYLLYRKRKMLKATIPLESSSQAKKWVPFHKITGALLCIIAILLYWYGSSTLRPLEYHVASLPLFIWGLILIAFNAQTARALVFPIAFLLLLIPPPSEVAYIAGATVAAFSSETSYWILKTMGLPVMQITTYGAPALVVTDPSGSSISFVIGAASSGIFSLIGFSVFAIFFTFISRGPAIKKAILFLTSLPIIYSLNILRIIVLILLGYWQGVEAVWDIFHLFGGWTLIFLGSLVLLFTAEKIWKIRIFAAKPRKESCLHSGQSLERSQDFCYRCGRLLKYGSASISKRDLFKIAALVISASLVLTLQVSVFASMGKPTEILPQNIGHYALRFIGRGSENFTKLAKLEDLLYYVYIPNNTSEERLQVMVNVDIAESWSVLHSWEISLISWPQAHDRLPQAIQIHDSSIKPREVRLLDNPPIRGLFSAFRDPTLSSNLTLVALEMGLIDLKGKTNSTSAQEQKYAKITLYTLTYNPGLLYEIEDKLLPLAEAIVNHWQLERTWSWIPLALSQNGIALMAIAFTLWFLVLGLRFVERLGERKSALKAYQKLASNEQFVIQAVHQASRKKGLAPCQIASYYQKITTKPIDVDSLVEKLEKAEKIGLLEKGIVSFEDEPFVTWKSRVRFTT